MASLREIKDAVSALSPDQLSEFRSWYERFDAEMWDERIERDAGNGRLDAVADAEWLDEPPEPPEWMERQERQQVDDPPQWLLNNLEQGPPDRLESEPVGETERWSRRRTRRTRLG